MHKPTSKSFAFEWFQRQSTEAYFCLGRAFQCIEFAFTNDQRHSVRDPRGSNLRISNLCQPLARHLVFRVNRALDGIGCCRTY
jgi:hypothetical protein